MESGEKHEKITIDINIASQRIPFTIPREKEGIYRKAASRANDFITYFEKTYHKGQNTSIALALIHGYTKWLEEETRRDACAGSMAALLEETDAALKKVL